MIKGAEQAFKFTTSFDFNDIGNIEVVFSQPHNDGTPAAPMPITKYYNRAIEEVDVWSASGKDINKTYYVDTKYYRYNSDRREFMPSDTLPTETDISGGAVTTWPFGGDCKISKVYKCDKSYYQYDPDTQTWDITPNAPSTDFIELFQVGVDNIPSDADKKRIYEYPQLYYQYNAIEGKWSGNKKILPIEEIDYWDTNQESTYDKSKTYCALETYHKYVDGAWREYGPDCMRPTEVYAWDSASADKSKIYMIKELYYQYNPINDEFEKTGVREVYYRYNVAKSEWEECEAADVVAEEIDLWTQEDVDADKYDENMIYVCKHVYYRYNAQTQAWEGSNNMLVPVIEINEWEFDNTSKYNTNKIYMCPARYYQYNIEESVWEEKEEAAQPPIVNLDYWSDSTDRDKSNIYLCGTTYFQYDSENAKWVPSTTFDMKVTQVDYPPENDDDQSKIYECSPIYYAYRGDDWESYKNVADAVRNDGFYPVKDDPKSFIAILYAEETMRFNETHKGRVQATVYSDKTNFTEKSKVEYFTVYPTLTNEIFSVIPDNPTEAIRVLDAGEVI